MHHLKTTLTVIGAVTVLVLAGNTIALATTGHAFILGKSNTASTLTTLSRTTVGTALKVQTKSSSSAPFSVNGKGKVTNLNADTLDGIDSSTLKTTPYVFTTNVTSSTTGVDLAIPVPAGSYVISYAAYLHGGTSGLADCYLNRSDDATHYAESEFNAGTSFPGMTGTGYVTKTASNTIDLRCEANAFTTFSNEPIQIIATRVDGAHTATIAQARVAH